MDDDAPKAPLYRMPITYLAKYWFRINEYINAQIIYYWPTLPFLSFTIFFVMIIIIINTTRMCDQFRYFFLHVIYHLLFVMCVCQNKIDENYFFCVAVRRHRGQVEWKVGQCDAGLLDIFDENKPTHLEYKKIKHYNNTFIDRAREKYWFGHVIIEIKFSLTCVL